MISKGVTMKSLSTFETLAMCILMTFSSVSCQNINTKTQSKAEAPVNGEEWQPAVYRGLQIGKSKYADMIRVLGKPTWSGMPYSEEKKGDPEVWHEYPNAGEFQSKITVIASKRTKVILAIDLYPENLSKDDAIKHFGSDYILTRYAFDECLGNEELGPMYESSTGPLIFIEYRKRGVAIQIDADNKVNQISFIKGPIGAATSKCNKGASANPATQ
jgi:hypothetical protein